jgi:hypothetical protein
MNKHVPSFEDFLSESLSEINLSKTVSDDVENKSEELDEATTSWKVMMKLIPFSSGPWSIVAVENGKVIDQSFNIAIRDVIPAEYESMREKHRRAIIHIEDAGGSVLWTSSKK